MTHEAPRWFRVADGVFDAVDAVIRIDGRRVPLSSRTSRLLEALVRAAPRTVTKEELLDALWPEEAVSEAALTQCVKELRRRLGDSAQRPRIVETVARRGYRLIVGAAPLSERGAAALSMPGDWIVVLLADVETSAELGREAEALRRVLDRCLSEGPRFRQPPRGAIARSLRLLGRMPSDRLVGELALSVARRTAGIRAVWRPSLRRLGSRYIIELEVVAAASGEVVEVVHREAKGDEELLVAFGQVGEESCACLEAAGVELPPTTRAWPAVTTDSLEALDAFARGLRWADRFEWHKACDQLEVSVRLDPKFSSAWAWLARGYLWLERPDDARAAARRASACSRNISEEERHLVAATAAAFAGNLAEETDHLEMLVALAGNDYWTCLRLAHCYLAAGRTGDSLRMRDICAQLRPEHFLTHSEAGFTRLFGEGDLDGAERHYQRVLELDPDHHFAIPFLLPSFRAWLQGDLDRAKVILDRVLAEKLAGLLPLGRVSALVHDARFRVFLADAETAVTDLRKAIAHVSGGSSSGSWAGIELALTLRDFGDRVGFRQELERVAACGTILARMRAWLYLGVEAARCSRRRVAIGCRLRILETSAEKCEEFGFPIERIVERVRRTFPKLIDAELALRDRAAEQALKLFGEACEELPLRLDAPLPLSTTDPREHLSARAGVARALASLGRIDEAVGAESWLIEHRFEAFITAQAGVGSWIGALARRANLLAGSGDSRGAARDASEVLARWGRLDPRPEPVERAARIFEEAKQASPGRDGAPPCARFGDKPGRSHRSL